MEVKEPILYGNYYHIYNRGNNVIDIFFETGNYHYFLRLYAKYIDPIAETYAWCLLKNHFHVLIRIKDKDEIKREELSYNTTEKPKIINPSRQFSHFFNAYTQGINKRHNRTGSLFERTFKRKLVTTETYFKQLIFYIHNNPVHHGFVDKINLYPWSSFKTILSDQTTKLKRFEVIEAYGDLENFIYYHQQHHHLNEIDNLIIE
ncbi:transposase [Yeosuana sp. AK3]